MSDDQGHVSVPIWMWGVGLLLVLLVAANMAMTLFSDRLDDVLSAKHVQATSFWSGWIAAVGACIAGWWWTGKALERSDRDSTRRLRTCFVLALCAVVLMAVASFEESLKRPQLAAVAVTLMALLVLPFAVSARGLAAGRGRHRRRRSSSEEGS